MQDREMASAEAKLANVHQMLQTLDTAQTNALVVEGLEAANAALKVMEEQTGGIEWVRELQAEFKEHAEFQAETARVLGADAADEITPELEAEFDAFLAEGGEGAQLPDVPGEAPQPASTVDVQLPDVPGEAPRAPSAEAAAAPAMVPA